MLSLIFDGTYDLPLCRCDLLNVALSSSPTLIYLIDSIKAKLEKQAILIYSRLIAVVSGNMYKKFVSNTAMSLRLKILCSHPKSTHLSVYPRKARCFPLFSYTYVFLSCCIIFYNIAINAKKPVIF